MMKTLTLFLAIVLAIATARAETIDNVFEEIGALLPGPNSFMELTDWYKANDPEVSQIFDYFSSQEFQDALALVMNEPGFMQILQWLFLQPSSAEIDYDRESIWNVNGDKKPGWKGFSEQWWGLVPYEEIKAIIKKRIGEGGDFAEFWHKLTEFKSSYEHLLSLPQVQNAVNTLNSLGFDFKAADKFIRDTFGWN